MTTTPRKPKRTAKPPEMAGGRRLPSQTQLRRLAVLLEAGIDQKHLASMIDPPKSRQAVGQVIWDTFRSPMAGARIAESIVRVVQDRFKALGKPGRAREVTMSYLGWQTPEEVQKEAEADA